MRATTDARGIEMGQADDRNWAAGRTAFITGATSGFGAALARRIVAGGGKVIATGRRGERLAALADELGHDRLHPLTLDIRNEQTVRAAIDALPTDFSDIDILFNNAGLALGLGKAPDTSLTDWKTMIDTNVTALVTVTHLLLPRLIARAAVGGRGDIVNVASVAASYPYAGGNVYGAAKAFVRQFSLNLRCDLLGKPIRVTSVEPGMCETEFSLVRFEGDPAAAAAVYKGMRPLSADDVALSIESVLRLPAHVNVNTIELMPVQQAFAGFAVDRG